MESSQNFFSIGAQKQVKMIVKLIRLYISLNVKNVKKLRQKEKRNTKIRHLRTFLCGGETIWKDFNCVGFFFFSFNFEKEIMFMSLDPTILY